MVFDENQLVVLKLNNKITRLLFELTGNFRLSKFIQTLTEKT